MTKRKGSVEVFFWYLVSDKTTYQRNPLTERERRARCLGKHSIVLATGNWFILHGIIHFSLIRRSYKRLSVRILRPILLTKKIRHMLTKSGISRDQQNYLPRPCSPLLCKNSPSAISWCIHAHLESSHLLAPHAAALADHDRSFSQSCGLSPLPMCAQETRAKNLGKSRSRVTSLSKILMGTTRTPTQLHFQEHAKKSRAEDAAWPSHYYRQNQS